MNELQNINVLNQTYLRPNLARNLRAAGAAENLIVTAMDALKSCDLVKECLSNKVDNLTLQ